MKFNKQKGARCLALLLAAALLITESLPVVALAEAPEDQPPPGNEMVSVTEEKMGDIAVEGFGAGSQPESEEETLPAPEEDKEAPVEEEAEETPASDTEPAEAPIGVLSDTVLPAEEADAVYQTADGMWVTGSVTEAVNQVMDGGTIKLLRDVTVNHNDNVALLIQDKEVTIQGEGHTLCLERGSLTLRETGRLHLGQPGYRESLTITSQDDSNYIVYMTGHAKLEMHDGVTLGPSKAGGQPAGVYLDSDASFIMHGGQIRDCENWASVSGGVLIAGNASFEMEDGVIENCTGYTGGAVVLNPSGAMGGDNTGNCRFRMSGGEIRNCSSRIRGGGALLAYTASAVQVDITGGKITDCTALENASGGGIYLYVNSSSARINLSGVTISGCKAAYGGGAFLAVENAEIGDGTVFTGNTARNSGGGLCLMSRKGIRFGKAEFRDNQSGYGGGIALYGGQNDLSAAVVCGNTASVAGDDLCAIENSFGVTSLVLPAGFGGNRLKDCGHPADQWYLDNRDNRWKCPGVDESISRMNTPVSGMVSTADYTTTLGLKAAHGLVKTEPVVVTPADLTVYSGGAGYQGLVEYSGNAAGQENGIPQPGYYITLPDSLNRLLSSEGGTPNLSGKLTFLYDDHAGTTRRWDLVLYGTGQNSTDSRTGAQNPARYVYKMQPSGEQQAPVRVLVVNADTHVSMLSDNFTPHSHREYQNCRMMIYPDGLNAGYVSARLTVGDKSYTCPAEIADGFLVVRSFTDRTTFALAETADAVAPAGITALAADGTTYFVNHSNVELTDTGSVRLLADTVREEETVIRYLKECLCAIK